MTLDWSDPNIIGAAINAAKASKNAEEATEIFNRLVGVQLKKEGYLAGIRRSTGLNYINFCKNEGKGRPWSKRAKARALNDSDSEPNKGSNRLKCDPIPGNRDISAAPVPLQKVNWRTNDIDLPDVVVQIRRGRSSKLALCEALRMAPQDIDDQVQEAIDEGYAIRIEDGIYTLEPRTNLRGAHCVEWDTTRFLLLAVLGDLHCGSKSCAEKEITKFWEFAYEEGARHFVIPGDLTDGNYHQGQGYEVKNRRIHRQVDRLLDLIPHKPDAMNYFITGNHDNAYFKATGKEVGKMLEECAITRSRSDVKFLGHDIGRLIFGKGEHGLRVMLSHETSKKAVGSVGYEEAPDLYIQGHFHDWVVRDIRNITYIRPGAFQWKTRFIRGYGGKPTVGGMLVLCRKDEEGLDIAYRHKTYRPTGNVWAWCDDDGKLYEMTSSGDPAADQWPNNQAYDELDDVEFED